MKRKHDEYRTYPEPDAQRGGCKVAWYYYRDHEAARIAAKSAKWNAGLQEALGYDFGFQSPGQIALVEERHGMPDKTGMYEVCIP